jgi:uncharacterized damage-inducible protein DinB/GNAT superfamily N-acetyltransferase
LNIGVDMEPLPTRTAEPPIDIRLLAVRDSLQALTELLHRAYAPLAARGMNFTAATQSLEVTAQRAAAGQCFVAVRDREIVGTVTVCGPLDAPEDPSLPWFSERNTAHLHQFAVAPEAQRAGVGARLVQRCEAWARDNGYGGMVSGAAVGADELTALFRRLGYTEIAQVQGPGRTYRSVILRKSLDLSPLREHLQTFARYHRWATERLLAAVDGLPEADYRRDVGLHFTSVHGTLNHLLVADEQIWRPRFADGASPVVALDTILEPDRPALGQRLRAAADAWLPLLDSWPEARLHGRLEYRRLGGEAVSMPFAATLAHVFNHGTHHRGQLSAALTAFGQSGPVLDMVVMLQAESRLR